MAALQAASSSGHENIVRLLLEKGADVNLQGGFYGSALQAASFHGHKNFVRLLLEKGAETNMQGGYYGSALQAASRRGHCHYRGAVGEGSGYEKPRRKLWHCSGCCGSEGHDAVVRLLLEKGAGMNVQGEYYGSAFQAASLGGHEAIVGLLLEKCPKVNVHSGHYGSALLAASSRGDEGIVRLLLKKGIDVYTGRVLWYCVAGGIEEESLWHHSTIGGEG